ncbi:hypothetical protein SteCoe_9699 [Stentor coeruleus]|uniref:Protein kinase domain-containing protein n=1 Tax=Stentor coeruleus TaxID=5963 RepID=A0A1R2CHF1_9CILI|nr:hypothetical protein SteCoe_9699 [Stentor coeruleus]
MEAYLNRYKEKQMLGIGYSSQQVYKVIDENNQVYVLKFVKLSKMYKSSLRREKKILQQYLPNNFIKLLYHENIIENDDTILMVMKFKYYPTDLNCYLISNKSIHNITYRKWARQICEGMDNLHKLNILHRDLKPENILLTKSSEDADVVIADLGFCIDINKSQAKTILGTKNYMAPEIASQKNYNGKIDVYSYGALVYYMLFKNFVTTDINNEVIFPRKVDKSTKEFLSKALQFDPKKRASFEELLKLDFLNFPEGENIMPAENLEPEIDNYSDDSDERDEETKIQKNKYIVDQELKKIFYIKAALYYLYKPGTAFLEKFTSETRNVFEIYFHKFSKFCAKKTYEKILSIQNIEITEELNNLNEFIELERKRIEEIKNKFTEPIGIEIKNEMQNLASVAYSLYSNIETTNSTEKVFYEILRCFNSYLKTVII